MTRFLLDTHVFLWWVENDSALKAETRLILENTANTFYLSSIVSWEIAIKAKLKKLNAAPVLLTDFSGFAASQGFLPLEITAEHAQATYLLPFHHRDPFDRMLVAQAIVEKLTIVTRDTNILRYDVTAILA